MPAWTLAEGVSAAFTLGSLFAVAGLLIAVFVLRGKRPDLEKE
ncbi:hypothetical protein ABT001_12660 [Streptomyces sp. NPDC002793]